MVAIAKTLVAAAAAHFASSTSSSTSSSSSGLGDGGCSVTNFVLQFPPSQTQLVAPTQPPKFIGLAFGVQNYTCTNTNNYTTAGAVGELIDVSCIAFDAGFSTIQDELYTIWTTLVPPGVTIQSIIDFLHVLNPPTVLAQHYFVTNPVTGSGISPKWDFTSSGRFEGNANAYMIGKTKGTIPSPDDPTTDIAWLDVANVAGDIADEIFRFDTVGGQPPTSCTFGQDTNISVKYTAKYIFYGGSIN